MKTFDDYLEMAQILPRYEVGKIYTFKWEGTRLKVKYLGLKKDNKGVHINSEIGDKLTDNPVLLFKWLEGDGSISSHGIKGDIVALGYKIASQHINE